MPYVHHDQFLTLLMNHRTMTKTVAQKPPAPNAPKDNPGTAGVQAVGKSKLHKTVEDLQGKIQGLRKALKVSKEEMKTSRTQANQFQVVMEDQMKWMSDPRTKAERDQGIEAFYAKYRHMIVDISTGEPTENGEKTWGPYIGEPHETFLETCKRLEKRLRVRAAVALKQQQLADAEKRKLLWKARPYYLKEKAMKSSPPTILGIPFEEVKKFDLQVKAHNKLRRQLRLVGHWHQQAKKQMKVAGRQSRTQAIVKKDLIEASKALQTWTPYNLDRWMHVADKSRRLTADTAHDDADWKEEDEQPLHPDNAEGDKKPAAK